MILTNNEGLNHGLTISSFVLGSIIMVLNIYLIIDLFIKLNRLAKFKKQDVEIYENKKLLMIIKLWTILLIPTLFIICTGMFIAYFVVDDEVSKDIVVIVNEVAFFLFMVVVIIFDTYWLKISNSIMVVIKNNKIALIDDVIEIKNIIVIRNDHKRKTFFINYKNETLDKNIIQIKLKYHWELKDFFNKIEVNKEFK